MAHKHFNGQAHLHHNDIDNRGIAIAFFLNLLFTVIEVIGGLWTNSMAILADAVHDMGDSVALAGAWYFQRMSNQRGDERYSYGYGRFSLLGAVLTAFILLFGGLYVLSESVPRILNPQQTNAQGMLGFAILGILVNGAGAIRVARSKGYNARMVTWHLFEDVLGWSAILFCSIILLYTKIHIIDPILSILITIYVMYNVGRNLKIIMQVFLQGVPKEIDLNDLEAQLRSVPGVLTTHHTHLWSLDGASHVFSTHLVMATGTSECEIDRIKGEVRKRIRLAGMIHTTLEVEHPKEPCGIDGPDCGEPPDGQKETGARARRA